MYKNPNRQLSCNSKLMNTNIVPVNQTFELRNNKNELVSAFKPGETYKLHMPSLDLKDAGSIWDASTGTFGTSKGVANPAAGGTCERTRHIREKCTDLEIDWTAQDSENVTFTYICALPEKARMIKATYFNELKSKASIEFACSNVVSNDTNADNSCRNKNLVGSDEQQNVMYLILTIIWFIGIRVYVANTSMDPCFSLGNLFSLAIDAVFLYFAVINVLDADQRDQLYIAIGLYLGFKFIEINDVLSLSFWVSGAAYAKAAVTVGYFSLLTLLVLAIFSSFHHWCNGEQDWETMTGSWGAFDSWQGTIPWWSLANFLVAYFIFYSKFQPYAILFALVTSLASVMVGAFGGVEAYSDYCTWIQMISSTLLLIAWPVHSYFASPRKNSLQPFDILNRVNIIQPGATDSRIAFFCYASAVFVTLITLLAVGALQGKQVPISMIVGVSAVIWPLVIATAMFCCGNFTVTEIAELMMLKQQQQTSDDQIVPLSSSGALRL